MPKLTARKASGAPAIRRNLTTAARVQLPRKKKRAAPKPQGSQSLNPIFIDGTDVNTDVFTVEVRGPVTERANMDVDHDDVRFSSQALELKLIRLSTVPFAETGAFARSAAAACGWSV